VAQDRIEELLLEGAALSFDDAVEDALAVTA
jgi:hypothetical protein